MKCAFGRLLTNDIVSNFSATRNDPRSLTIYGENVEKIVPIPVIRDRNDERCKQLGEDVKKFYFGLTEPSLATVDAYLLVSINQSEMKNSIQLLTVLRHKKELFTTNIDELFFYWIKRASLTFLQILWFRCWAIENSGTVSTEHWHHAAVLKIRVERISTGSMFSRNVKI